MTDSIDTDPGSVLCQAIKTGRRVQVEQMLQETPDLANHIDMDEWGPTHVCAQSGETDLLKTLVEKYGVDINQPTAYGNTVVHVAAFSHQWNTLVELKKMKADFRRENKGRETFVDVMKRTPVAARVWLQIFDGCEDLLCDDDRLTITLDNIKSS